MLNVIYNFKSKIYQRGNKKIPAVTYTLLDSVW